MTAAPYVVTEDSLITNVDVLRREELDLQSPGGLGGVLAELPGLRSTSFGAGASRPVIRGLAGPRVQVLSNGLGMIDASALSPDHAVASDPAEAARIEVLRGPSALAYGGSAIGGVVNVIDERIPTSPARGGVEGRFAVQGSTVDAGGQIAASVKAGSGPLVVTLDGVRRETGDYAVPVPPESLALAELEGEEPEPGDEVENSWSELSQYGVGVGWLTAVGRFGASVKRTETSYGVPGHAHEGEEEESVSIDLKQTRVDLRGDVDLPIRLFERLNVSLGWAEYEHVELEGDEVGTRFASSGYEGRIELVQPERDGWNGAFGLQALDRDFDAVGDEAYVPPSSVREVGIYTLQRLDRDAWGVEGGLRLDQRDLESVAGDRDYTNVSASIGGFLRPSDSWFLGLAASRNVRAPVEAELFADGPHVATQAYEVGDPDLEPETAYTVEFTAHFEKGPLDFDAHAFWAEYEGFIDLRPTGDVEDDLPVFAYRQTDATFYGVEAEGGVETWSDGERSVRLEAAYDWVRGETDLGPPARVSPWSATARLVYSGPSVSGRIETRHVAGQDRLAEFELPTDSYTAVNAFASYKPDPDGGLTVFAEVRNLGDVEIREHVSFLKDLAPQPGRNVRTGLLFTF